MEFDGKMRSDHPRQKWWDCIQDDVMSSGLS